MKATTTLGVKVEAGLQRRLKALGQARGRSTHWLVRAAIERYVEMEEDAERIKRETLQRWERYQLTGEHAPEKDVMDWLGSWGTSRERGWRKRRG